MRERLAFLVMEDEDGRLGFQCYDNPESSLESFDNLKGKAGQKPMRATFLVLKYGDKGVEIEKAMEKMLPVPLPEKAETSWVLGRGPVEIEKDGIRDMGEKS